MSERIRILRQALGLSQTEFAKKMGMTRSMVSNMELGLIEIPDYKIEMICKVFNVRANWLRTGEGDMFNPASESLDALAEAHQLDDLTRAIIKTLITMKPAHREAFQQIVTDAAAAMRSAKYDDAQEIIANAAAHYDSALSSARARSLPEEDLPGASELHTK